MTSSLILIFGILILIGTFASKIGNRFGVPVLLVFLGIGMVAGSDILGFVSLDNYVFTRDLANLALIFILFDSGFSTKRENLKKYAGNSELIL